MGLLKFLFGLSENSNQKSNTNDFSHYDCNIRQPATDKYYTEMHQIEAMWAVMYNLKSYSGDKAAKIELLCKQNLISLEMMCDEQKKNGFDSSVPPNVPAFKRLAMLYEKQERFDEAISICVSAIKIGATSDGSKGTMYGRLARMIKKAGRKPNKEELDLLQ